MQQAHLQVLVIDGVQLSHHNEGDQKDQRRQHHVAQDGDGAEHAHERAALFFETDVDESLGRRRRDDAVQSLVGIRQFFDLGFIQPFVDTLQQ